MPLVNPQRRRTAPATPEQASPPPFEIPDWNRLGNFAWDSYARERPAPQPDDPSVLHYNMWGTRPPDANQNVIN